MTHLPSTRRPYPSDETDEEWVFIAPYLALLPEETSQRKYERLPQILAGFHFLAFAGVMLSDFTLLMVSR